MNRALLLALGSLLAGCAAPPTVPGDATVATDPDLPGLTLFAWVETRGGFTYLHGIAQNDGEPVATKEDCGYLWQSTLRHNGTVVTYQQPREEPCDWWYDTMRTGDHREFLHSWDGRLWNGTISTQAPPGEYSWTLVFLLRDGTDHDTQTPVPNRFVAATVTFAR